MTTTLQTAVSGICAYLSDLSWDDQIRALEAARIHFGLPVAQTVYQEPSTMPTVQVSMDGACPVVMGTVPPMEPPRRGVIVTALSPEFELDARGVPRRRSP